MDAQTIEKIVRERFRLDHAPTLSSTGQAPIAFTRLHCDREGHGWSGTVPTEASFAFQVMLQPVRSWTLQNSRGRSALPPTRAGDAFLFDLSSNPRIAMNTPFDTIRIYIPQSALKALSYANGVRHVSGLRPTSSHPHDPTLHGLALTVRAAMDRPREVSALFMDAVTLAVFAHVAQAYGGASDPRNHRGGLAPWQLCRIADAIEADIGGVHDIAGLAGLCGLSPNYFIRAFKHSTGLAPHQWLLVRRTERACTLMKETAMDLTAIALACGFVDQSHFSRIFSRLKRQSPGHWRRVSARSSIDLAKAGKSSPF